MGLPGAPAIADVQGSVLSMSHATSLQHVKNVRQPGGCSSFNRLPSVESRIETVLAYWDWECMDAVHVAFLRQTAAQQIRTVFLNKHGTSGALA